MELHGADSKWFSFFVWSFTVVECWKSKSYQCVVCSVDIYVGEWILVAIVVVVVDGVVVEVRYSLVVVIVVVGVVVVVVRVNDPGVLEFLWNCES